MRSIVDQENGRLKPKSGILWLLECELQTNMRLDVMDHSIIVGKVLASEQNQDLDSARHVAMIYAQSAYHYFRRVIILGDDAVTSEGLFPRQVSYSS